ncbi:hypothetical protein [Patiriisocius hiemis]|uniref:Lipocalin-like domain-containing protein n=1 Tax=Patiriisocius hiemis TaxID=3075604 RepID=A0ABU2YE04_9FLAO|nr:hypothetical protein [Constantimarinum sp. W242]MDT0556091.1 hypothetical protein [Constantimarinum sp. W242]
MRNLIALATICITFLFVSCDTDDSNSDNNGNSSADQVTMIAQQGTWRITNYNDSGDDETSDFAGYSFSFNEDGSLVATNGTNTVTGTWSVDDSNDSSDDDSGTDDDDFNIFFPVPEDNDFEDLNDDWDIVSVTNNRIELFDVSGGDGSTDRLTFEKE